MTKHIGGGVLTSIENGTQRIFEPLGHPGPGTFLMVADEAYWCYLGRVVAPIVIQRLEFGVIVAGVGAQTAEIGLFSTPLPPNRASQVLTKIEATGSLDSLLTTGVKSNSSPFASVLPIGTHVWAGIRVAMATTQPTVLGIAPNFGLGIILSTAGAGALTGAGPWTGALLPATAAEVAPLVRGTLDA